MQHPTISLKQNFHIWFMFYNLKLSHGFLASFCYLLMLFKKEVTLQWTMKAVYLHQMWCLKKHVTEEWFTNGLTYNLGKCWRNSVAIRSMLFVLLQRQLEFFGKSGGKRQLETYCFPLLCGRSSENVRCSAGRHGRDGPRLVQSRAIGIQDAGCLATGQSANKLSRVTCAPRDNSKVDLLHFAGMQNHALFSLQGQTRVAPPISQ